MSKEKIAQLKAEVADLKKQIAGLTLANSGVNSRLTKSIELRNGVNDENEGLKAQVELLKTIRAD